MTHVFVILYNLYIIFQAVVNSTEWELILDLHEFDEPWMRFAKGKEKLLINITGMQETPVMKPFQFIETYFDGDWRDGKEIRQVKITQRDYQIAGNETKTRFSNKTPFMSTKTSLIFDVEKNSWMVRKSIKPFLRMEISSDNSEVYLRPFNQPRPARIIITNGITQRYNSTAKQWYDDFTPGYKRFKNIKIETKVGSQNPFWISIIIDF